MSTREEDTTVKEAEQPQSVDEPTFREGRYLLQQDIERLKNVVVPEDLRGLAG